MTLFFHILRRFAIICISLLTGVICLVSFFLESPIDPADYDIKPSLAFTGPLEVNSILSNAEQILEGYLYGPESLTYHLPTQTIFTGTRDGSVMQIFIGNKQPKIIHIFRYHNIDSSLCNATVASVQICGRPLGMRISPFDSNLLVIIDAYLGVFEYQIKEGVIKHLLKTGALIKDSNEPPIRYLNDFDFTHDGKLVISEPSFAFDDYNFHYIVLERSPKGRVLLFDHTTSSLQIRINHLVIPNGIQMDASRKCVFVAEMGLYRIIKHCMDRHKIGEYDILIEGLPGFPDNIRLLPSSGLLAIPIPMPRLIGEETFLSSKWLRDFIAKIMSITHPVDALPEKEYGLVILIESDSGTIVESWHDPTSKTIASITQVLEIDNDTFYFGNDGLFYIGRLVMNVIQPE
uniref:Strictosidine synthase conserved region domain-containing protein n=1 Tax=Acrobeloides nanus TaxID=290746 RepID=A0A914C9Y4_9BILA